LLLILPYLLILPLHRRHNLTNAILLFLSINKIIKKLKKLLLALELFVILVAKMKSNQYFSFIILNKNK